MTRRTIDKTKILEFKPDTDNADHIYIEYAVTWSGGIRNINAGYIPIQNPHQIRQERVEERAMEDEITRIMSMSDDEICAEVRAEGRDPDQVADEMRALIAPILNPEEHPGWFMHLAAFRLALGAIERQDMTIRELRRLLLACRTAGLNVAGGPDVLARHINGLEPLK